MAVVAPTKRNPDVAKIVAIAARDPARAAAWRMKHKLPEVEVMPSYEALLANPSVDAIYLPLPPALHYEWALKALMAGKHVLVEKPFATNEVEARQMVAFAESRGLVVMEAMHWFYHPLREYIRSIVASGVIGRPVRLHASFQLHFDAAAKTNASSRYNFELGGGAALDIGGYTLSCLIALMGGEVPVVRTASAVRWSGDERLDESVEGSARFVSGDVEATFQFSYLAERAGERRAKMPHISALSTRTSAPHPTHCTVPRPHAVPIFFMQPDATRQELCPRRLVWKGQTEGELLASHDVSSSFF